MEYWLDLDRTLQRRHNEYDGVSNHRSLDFLLNRLSRRKSKKTSKHRVTSLCERNSPVIGGSPQSNAEYVSIWWRHHGISMCNRKDTLNNKRSLCIFYANVMDFHIYVTFRVSW